MIDSQNNLLKEQLLGFGLHKSGLYVGIPRRKPLLKAIIFRPCLPFKEKYGDEVQLQAITPKIQPEDQVNGLEQGSATSTIQRAVMCLIQMNKTHSEP